MKNSVIKFLIILSIFFLHSESNAQLREITASELESYIFKNHQSGKLGSDGLFTQMIIELEDFDLMQDHFENLKILFSESFQFELFELDRSEKKLKVIYDRSRTKTDDFLKIFKETMLKKGVLMYLYQETVWCYC